MISQKCPRCASRRIRSGYRPTPLIKKIFCRFNLLCDNCNWVFTGFAVPGTLGRSRPKPPRSRSKKPEANHPKVKAKGAGTY